MKNLLIKQKLLVLCLLIVSLAFTSCRNMREATHIEAHQHDTLTVEEVATANVSHDTDSTATKTEERSDTEITFAAPGDTGAAVATVTFPDGTSVTGNIANIRHSSSRGSEETRVAAHTETREKAERSETATINHDSDSIAQKEAQPIQQQRRKYRGWPFLALVLFAGGVYLAVWLYTRNPKIKILSTIRRVLVRK